MPEQAATLFNLSNGKEMGKIVFKDRIDSDPPQFSPDGKILAVKTSPETIDLYVVATAKLLRTLNVPQDPNLVGGRGGFGGIGFCQFSAELAVFARRQDAGLSTELGRDDDHLVRRGNGQ